MHPDRATGDRSDMFFHNPDAPHETAMPCQLGWCVKGAVNGAGFAVDQRFRPFLPGASLRFRRATATCGLPENQKWSEVVSFDHLRMDYAWTLRFRGCPGWTTPHYRPRPRFQGSPTGGSWCV